jgi:hypothetical protein
MFVGATQAGMKLQFVFLDMTKTYQEINQVADRSSLAVSI